MKKKLPTNKREANEVKMKKEYAFNYSKARPNRFVARLKENHLVVILDSDISQIFTSSESVNSALRAMIQAIPQKTRKRVA